MTATEMVNSIMGKTKKYVEKVREENVFYGATMFDKISIEFDITKEEKDEMSYILLDIYKMYKRYNDNNGMIAVQIALNSIS